MKTWILLWGGFIVGMIAWALILLGHNWIMALFVSYAGGCGPAGCHPAAFIPSLSSSDGVWTLFLAIALLISLWQASKLLKFANKPYGLLFPIALALIVGEALIAFVVIAVIASALFIAAFFIAGR